MSIFCNLRRLAHRWKCNRRAWRTWFFFSLQRTTFPNVPRPRTWTRILIVFPLWSENVQMIKVMGPLGVHNLEEGFHFLPETPQQNWLPAPKIASTEESGKRSSLTSFTASIASIHDCRSGSESTLNMRSTTEVSWEEDPHCDHNSCCQACQKVNRSGLSRQNSETYLKAPDYEGEGFRAVLLDDLTSLHGEVVLLLARLRLHRLHRPEPREVAVREEDEVSLPPCLHVLSPLVQVALLYHLHFK